MAWAKWAAALVRHLGRMQMREKGVGVGWGLDLDRSGRDQCVQGRNKGRFDQEIERQ